jgi:hypothetical protein
MSIQGMIDERLRQALAAELAPLTARLEELEKRLESPYAKGMSAPGTARAVNTSQEPEPVALPEGPEPENEPEDPESPSKPARKRASRSRGAASNSDS